VHAQGIIHRDIKPDNLLVSEDDVLKVVDFGVSEMFAKSDEMMIAKSAGSPAFQAPELCIARHGDVSGTAADIWSMGVTLYCLRYGRLPFESLNILDMYEAIRTQSPDLPGDENPDFIDLMGRILDKDPKKRISMPELRVRSTHISFLTFRAGIGKTNILHIGAPMGHETRRRHPPPHRRELRRSH
jgi:[calcium/calmodulin-dependent protein kinase] kinase